MSSNARSAGLVLAALLAPAMGNLAADPPPDGDLGRMQGTWATNSFGGTRSTFTFRGNKLEVKAEGVEYIISVMLDERAKPEKTIDMKTEESTTGGAVGKTSPGIYKFDGDDRLVICFRATGERPMSYETRGFEQWRLELKGEPEKTEARRPAPKAADPAPADSDAPLPEGWPAATSPGTIEVKTYPKYRSAVLRLADAKASEDEKLFFPLFAHISGKGIAMTTPVVMTYEPRVIERVGAKGEVSMEFLYRRADQGEAGPGVGKVRVEDRPSMTVVSLGVQGELDEARMREAVAKLREWLEAHREEWVAAGPPRRLGYHGPQTPAARQLNEVQLPIKPAGAQAQPTAGGQESSR
jgi:uncharacterized protein (TIGR03067 family)